MSDQEEIGSLIEVNAVFDLISFVNEGGPMTEMLTATFVSDPVGMGSDGESELPVLTDLQPGSSVPDGLSNLEFVIPMIDDALDPVPVEHIQPSIINRAFMSAILDDPPPKATMLFSTEPKKFYKFCFKCDVQKRSGALVAVKSKKNKKLFPTVKCKFHSATANPIYLHVDLYERLEGHAVPRVSAHLLVDCVERIDAKPICIKMAKSQEEADTYEAVLENLFVMRTNKDRRKITLQSKYEEFQKWQQGQVGLTEQQKSMANNRAIRENEEMQGKVSHNPVLLIGVQAYMETINRTHVQISDLVYSAEIHCGELKISEIDPKRGTVNGNTKVYLKLSSDLVEDVNVIFSINAKDKDCPEIETSMQRDEIHRNVIVVTTPNLPMEILDLSRGSEDITSEVYLRRTSDNAKSNRVKFVYESGITEQPPQKRNRIEVPTAASLHNVLPYLCTDSASDMSPQGPQAEHFVNEKTKNLLQTAMQQLSRIKQVNNKTEELENLNAAYMANFLDGDGNSIYHDAIASDDFLTIYRMCESLPLRPILAKIRNKKRENLLHYACKLNVFKHVRPLCNLGSTIYTQNLNKETPLHLALKLGKIECLQKFEDLLRDIKEYTDILEAFKWLLNVYDKDGLTVLHLAVIKNRPELVGSILRFCEDEKLDVMTMETLGRGNTILHLAVEANSKDMTKLILRTIPNAANYENYAGFRPNIPDDWACTRLDEDKVVLEDLDDILKQQLNQTWPSIPSPGRSASNCQQSCIHSII